MKFILTSRQVSLFLVTCLALMSAGVLAKGHSQDLFCKFSGNSLILLGGEPAINPTTGTPYFFVFVDNENPRTGDGTFKNPFPTLAAAQAASAPNNIIYVFPGDRTDKGMNAGITLKAGQQLLGAGIKQRLETTVGSVKIPAQAKCLPTVSNSDFAATAPSHGVVVLNAGNNVVSGFNLVDVFGGNTSSPFDPSVVSAGIRIENGLNYLIKKNISSTNSNNGGGNCFNLYGGGNVTVLKNTFIGQDTGDTYGVDMETLVNPFEGTFTFDRNLFTGANDSSGLDRGLYIFFPAIFNYIGDITISILCNTLNSKANTANDSQAGIVVYPSPILGQPVTAIINGNCVNLPTPGFTEPLYGIRVHSGGPGLLTATVNDNVSITPPGVPGYSFVGAAGQLSFTASNNKGSISVGS